MATNLVYRDAANLELYTNAGVKSGDPVAVGEITGVALGDEDTAGYTVIRRKGVFNLEVTAIDAGDPLEPVPISIGDTLYIADGELSNNDSGTQFGYALEDIDSGTKTIRVLLGGKK